MNLKTNTTAKFPHPQFFLTKLNVILGSTFFMLIMKTFLDTFTCNFSVIIQ